MGGSVGIVGASGRTYPFGWSSKVLHLSHCLDLCRGCSGPGWLAWWWLWLTHTLAAPALTQTVTLRTEDLALRCPLTQASPPPWLESLW